MLPVVATLKATKDQIFLYALALVPVSLSLWLTGWVGWIYVAAAVILGIAFAREAWQLRRDQATAMSVFRTSIYYLALIFFAVAADTLILG